MSSSAKEKDLGQPPPSRGETEKIKTKNSTLEENPKNPPAATDPPPYVPRSSEKFPGEKRGVPVPAQPKGASSSRARNARLLWVLMACLVGSIYVIFTRSSMNSKYNQEKAGKPYESYCSGHGIELRDNSCVCDLGYTGNLCQDKYPIESGHREKITVSTPSVLLVTDTFGPLNPYNELASAYKNIAIHLGSNSFHVTVLYVGEESIRFSEISNDFASKNIELVQLPSSGLNYGPSPSTTVSVDVFQWMLVQRQDYNVVHFQANSGAGYYTLLAQHQGLTNWKSKFVVGLDSTSVHSLMQINSGDDGFLSTDLESLKLEYMQEKSVEYADTVLAPSKSILDDVRALDWAFEESSAVVLPHIPSKSAEPLSKAERIVAKELVFIGSLNIINGVPVFCDAVDRLIETGAVSENQPLRVTFLGSPDYIREMTSVEYLETRSINWKNVHMEVIPEPHTVQDIVTYMTKPESSRIGVLPRLYDGSGFLFQELVGNNVPVVASRLPVMEELVEASSSINAMFDVNDFKGLAVRLSNAISDGLMPLEPAAAREKKSWSSIFQEIANAEIAPENDSDENIPLVTVVLVHRNRPKYLEQAIQSLYQQTYKNFEVILVDDGSDDLEAIHLLQELAWEWWEKRGWKVLREPHRYLGAARNTGVKHAKGSYVLFMDDDDYAKPHQIETLVHVAERTHADVITAGHDLFDGDQLPPGRGLIERRVPLGAAKYVGMLENCFGDSNMMVLRSFFVDFGGFSEDFGVGFEDYEFLAKTVLRGHHLEVVPESLHWYRRHRDAMSFNTDRKANQIRFLRAYMAEHQGAPRRQQALLEYTKTKFFARDAPSLDAYEGEHLNTTMTGPGPQPTQHPCGPSLIIDDFAGKNSTAHGTLNRIGLKTDWMDMNDAAVAGGQLMLTPKTTDESYYYSVLSDGCFDATMFNTLEIVVGAQTPVDSSFAVVLRSPKECGNTTVVDVRSLRTTQYASFNGTRQVLRIQLSDFELDTCKLHSLVLEDFVPSDGKTTYVIDSIRFYTECLPYPTQVYQFPATPTGSAPQETGAYNEVALISMVPPAANISSDLTFNLTGKGFQNYGVNLYCAVDGKKTNVAARVASESAASCSLEDVDVLGSHTLTLSVNGTLLPYGRTFFLYPSDAHVTTCQAKGYVQHQLNVRVDGHNLVDSGHVACVTDGPGFQKPVITRAMPAWSQFDPYRKPPPQENGQDGHPFDNGFPYGSISEQHHEFDKYFPKDGDFPKDLFPAGHNPGYIPPGADVSAFIDSAIHKDLPTVKEYLSKLAQKTGDDYLSMIAQQTGGEYFSKIAEKTGEVVQNIPTNTNSLTMPTEIKDALSSLLLTQTEVNTADLPEITGAAGNIIQSANNILPGHVKRGLPPNTGIMKAHSWSCLMNVTTGGLYTVRLSLDDGASTVPGHVNTWVYDSVPNIVDAGFDDSGASVTVSFNKSIRVVGHDVYDYSPIVDCSKIFDLYIAGNAKLGNLDKTRCSVNGDKLEIALSSDSTLRPGDQLQFTDRAIFSRANPFASEGWLLNNTFVVRGPTFVPMPVVVANAPKVVGVCNVGYVDVADSYNDGGRPLTFYWSSNSTNANITNALSSLNNTSNTYLEFPADKLTGGERYWFTVVAENFFGGKSEPNTVTFVKSDNPVPQIQILGPDVQYVVTTDDYFLNTETTRSSCAYEGDIEYNYHWSFEPGSPTFVIPSKRLNSSTLYIQSRSLASNVYTLRVEVSTASAPNFKGFDTVVIHGLAPAPSFAIGNGDLSVGITSDLLVYAYYYDPLGDAPAVSWSCHVMDGNTETPCTITGNAVLNPNTLASGSTLQFNVPNNTLLANKQYKFTGTLTPTQNRDVITDEILVTTVQTMIPVVAATVILPTYNARRMLSGDVLNIFADVQSGTYTTYKGLSFAWNSVSGTKQVSGSTVKLSTIPMNNDKVTQKRDQLIIRPNTLLPGNTYRFQVVVTDNGGASGSGFTDVTVAKAPVVGTVASSPSVGNALSDTFEITASQWTVDPPSDMPLSYQFDVFTSDVTTGLPAFTFPFQSSPKIKTFLPTPTGEGQNIWVVVTGKSKFGATSSKAVSIQVNKVVRSVTEMKSVFTNAAKDALSRGDTGAYLRIATGVVNDLLAQLANASTKKLRVRADNSDLTDTLNSVLDGVLTNVVSPSPVTGATLELHACTLQTLVSMPSIVNSTNAAAVLETLRDRIKILEEAQNASPSFRITPRTKQCIAKSMGSLTSIYAQYSPSSEATRKTILEASTLINALYMRDMACGAPTEVFTLGSTTEYLVKSTLSSFTLSADNNDTVVSFPEDIPVNGNSDVNCFCMQETVQDAGLYSFVDKEVAGSGTVQIASTASNLRLRDCSSVQRSVPLNGPEVLGITDLPNPIELTLKLTPTSKTLFDAGKHDVKCVYYDTSSSPPVLSTAGVATTHAGGDKYTCGTSHLSTLLLVLSDKVEEPTSSATDVASTATPTSTSTPTSTGSADGGEGGIGSGAIAGIVIGVCGGAALAGGAAYFILKKK